MLPQSMKQVKLWVRWDGGPLGISWYHWYPLARGHVYTHVEEMPEALLVQKGEM